jgi:DNA-directed RNA polymerase subunit M/transcription elongation factor TFIIS
MELDRPRRRANIAETRERAKGSFTAHLLEHRSCFPERPDGQLMAAAAAIEYSCFEAALIKTEMTEECYETCVVFSAVYTSICSVLLGNLTEPVLERVHVSRDFLVQLGRLTERDLNAGPLQTLQDEIDHRNREGKIAPKTSMTYPCNKCHGPTVSQQRQTRGADEDGTIFVHCIPCNHDFKR